MTFTNYEAFGLVMPQSELADRLGEAYDNMKTAEAEYLKLRDEIVETGVCDGDYYKIDIQHIIRRSPKLDLLIKKFGQSNVEDCCEFQERTIIRVKKK